MALGLPVVGLGGAFAAQWLGGCVERSRGYRLHHHRHLRPGAFRKPSWRVIFDIGIGGALLSDWEFGRQDAGGPFQFIAHGGLSFELPWNLVVGGRFHHMSDGTIYGDSRGVDFYMLELSYYFGD